VKGFSTGVGLLAATGVPISGCDTEEADFCGC